MQSQNGDVQLSVTLDTKGLKSDAQKIKEEIKKAVGDRTKSNGPKVTPEIDDAGIKDATNEMNKLTDATREVETEMEKLRRIKGELASGELSPDTQSELDRLQGILDRRRQTDELAQQELATQEAITESVAEEVGEYAEYSNVASQINEMMGEAQGNVQATAEAQQEIAEKTNYAVREVERMRTALGNVDEIAKDMAYDLEMFGQGNKYSDEFKQLNIVAQDLTKEFNKGAQEMFKMETLGQSETQEFQVLAEKTALIAEQLRDANGMLNEMRQSGEAYTKGVNTTELKQVERAYDAITNKITLKRQAEKEAEQQAKQAAKQEAQAAREAEREQARLAKEAQRTAKAMQQTGTAGTRALNNTAKSAKKLNKELKQTSGHGRKLKLNFLSILGAAIGIRSLYALFSKLRSAITDSMKTLAQWNNGNNKTNESISMLMNSLNQLKNSLGAAFVPILTAVAPALNYLINLITQVINAIAQLVAYLSGQNTWIRAKKQADDYAKSLDKTGAAAKKAQGRLAAFDDLNVLGKDDDGGGAGGINPNDLFEEVPIESWVDELFAKLKAFWETLQPIFAHLWDTFKQGFLDAFPDIQNRFEKILDNLKRIKSALINIFTDPKFINAFKKYVDSLVYLLGSLLGMVASIITSIVSNITGGIANWLEEDGDRIKSFIENMLDVWTEINLQLAKFAQALSNIFTVLEGSNAVSVTGNLLGIFTGLFGDITLLASKAGRDIVELLTQPIIDNQEGIKNAFDGILGSLKTLTDGVKEYTQDMGDAWNALYDDHIGPFIDSVTTGLSAILDTILSMWDEYIQPILDDTASKLDTLLNDYLKPFCTDVLGIVGQIIDILKIIWNLVIVPFIQWLIQNILPVISPIIQGVMNLFIAMRALILTVITFITGLLKTLLGFVKDVFEVGWNQAWDNMKKTFNEAWERMKEQLTGTANIIMDGIELIINGVIRAVNKIIDAISKLGKFVDIPGFSDHSGGGARVGGGASGHLEEIKLPRLAQGAVIPPNKEFLAMLGDQTHGTNIEAPLDTIKEAFADVVANMQVQNTGYSEMQLDGETFARLIVPYVISELNRQGFDVSVIGA